MDKRHEFLNNFMRRDREAEDAMIAQWRRHFEATGLPYRVGRGQSGRIKQLYIHRIIKGAWCCHEGENISGEADQDVSPVREC
jgi:hypothetical protein